MKIGDRIRKKRIESGISQTELANKLKIKKQTMNKYEMNIITNIPSDKIEEIAKILDTSPAYLMGWEDNLNKITADLIPDILSDENLIKHIQKLNSLNKEHKQTIFDNIDYWYEKEGH